MLDISGTSVFFPSTPPSRGLKSWLKACLKGAAWCWLLERSQTKFANNLDDWNKGGFLKRSVDIRWSAALKIPFQLHAARNCNGTSGLFLLGGGLTLLLIQILGRLDLIISFWWHIDFRIISTEQNSPVVSPDKQWQSSRLNPTCLPSCWRGPAANRIICVISVYYSSSWQINSVPVFFFPPLFLFLMLLHVTVFLIIATPWQAGIVIDRRWLTAPGLAGVWGLEHESVASVGGMQTLEWRCC